MNKKWLYPLAFLSVLIIYHITYGVATLVPTNINWLMSARHDWGTHYLGWFFYRNEPWHFPLGKISNYVYPVGTNVGFTDSIPLMAIFFKLFNGILPSDFQYFGIWLLGCDLLVAWYTLRLMRLFNLRPFISLMAVILLVANPVLVYRGLHPALCAHWLLIASIYHYFLDPRNLSPARILQKQLVILALASVINPYLCFMVFGFSIILPLRLFFFDRIIGWKKALSYIAVSMLSLLVLWFITGLITIGNKEDLNVSGAFGLYSLNLNAFFNSFGFSRFFRQLPWVSWHQYEGFMYLGAGMFLLILAVLAYRLIWRRSGHQQPTAEGQPYYKGSYLPLYILVALYSLFALTNVVSLNDKILFRISLPGFLLKLGEIFRASSRFFWPCYYLILLSTIIATARMQAVRWLAPGLLGLAVILQFVDCWRLLDSRHFTYGTYTPPLNADWQRLMESTDKVILYPPFEATYQKDLDYQDFCFLAAKTMKPVTTGYVARVNNTADAAYMSALVTDLLKGRVSRALYITTPANLKVFSVPLLENRLKLNMLDGYCYLYAGDSLKNYPIETITHRLSHENATTLDSLRKEIQPGLFHDITATANASTMTKDSLSFFMETMQKGSSVLSLSGWAFKKNTTSNKKDSIYALLISDKRTYAGDTKIEKRPDISANFKADLDNAGFKGLLSTAAVDSGEYRIAIGVRDPSGRISYAVSDSVLRVNSSHLVY